MIILYIVILLLLFWSLSVSRGSLRDDFLGKEQTNVIKGFSIALVFVSHISGYMWDAGYAFDGWGDSAYLTVRSAIGQLCVVMFLFYSGYGVSESIKAKSSTYLRSFPKKRILTTLINYDVAVIMFLLLGLALGSTFTPKQLVATFLGWESIGQSNWYICVILLCYVATYLGYGLAGKWKDKENFAKFGCWLSVFLVFIIFITLKWLHRPGYWHSTIGVFAAGLIFSTYKSKWLTIVHKKYWAHLTLGIVAFVVLYSLNTFLGSYPIIGRVVLYNIVSIAFAYMVVLITMKVKIGNPVLCWMGACLFPIYIYQRIPMMLFAHFDNGAFPATHTMMYIMLSVGCTGIIAYLYKYWKITLK